MPASNAKKRQARINTVVEELCAKADDPSALKRCRTLALELVELFQVEETHRVSPDVEAGRAGVLAGSASVS